MFDGDAYVRALDPPAIKLDGRVYMGRVLSIDEWVPLEPALRKIQGGAGTLADAYHVIGEFCRIAFKHPWWAFWRRPVYKKIMKLPPAALTEVTRDFLESQARAMGMGLPPRDDSEKEASEDSPPVI